VLLKSSTDTGVLRDCCFDPGALPFDARGSFARSRSRSYSLETSGTCSAWGLTDVTRT
jgi:hypothetical protein